MIGMAIAAVTTLGADRQASPCGRHGAAAWIWVLRPGVSAAAAAGASWPRRVEMTKMPELVAFMHSMIGLAAVFIAVAAVAEPTPSHRRCEGRSGPTGNRLELFLGAAIGAITFSGSVIAFGKLSGTYKFRLFKGAPVVFAGQHMLNLVLALATIGLGLMFIFTESWPPSSHAGAAFVLGVLIIIPIGGADMPVVISMLNSYSGWAAAGIGFSLNNPMLIIAGSLVGSSGAILSLHHVQGDEPLVLQRDPGRLRRRGGRGGGRRAAPVKSGSADDAAFMLGNAESVIIVPGYGLAVARAQHAVKELAEKLTTRAST
jgi:NAD(P) transhydrogenase subunit beta